MLLAFVFVVDLEDKHSPHLIAIFILVIFPSLLFFFSGNTSMDPMLSMIIANMAKIGENCLVHDPFVGTGKQFKLCKVHCLTNQKNKTLNNFNFCLLLCNGNCSPDKMNISTQNPFKPEPGKTVKVSNKCQCNVVNLNYIAVPSWKSYPN